MFSTHKIVLITLSIIPIVTKTIEAKSSSPAVSENGNFNLTRLIKVIEADCKCDGKKSCNCYLIGYIPEVHDIKIDVNFTLLPDGKNLNIVSSLNEDIFLDVTIPIGDIDKCVRVRTQVPYANLFLCVHLNETKIVHHRLHSSVNLHGRVGYLPFPLGPWIPHNKPNVPVDNAPELQ